MIGPEEKILSQAHDRFSEIGVHARVARVMYDRHGDAVVVHPVGQQRGILGYGGQVAVLILLNQPP